MNKFYMVLADNRSTTVVRHPSKVSAQMEARRLACANPGVTFHVLSAFEGYRIPPQGVEVLKYADEQNF